MPEGDPGESSRSRLCETQAAWSGGNRGRQRRRLWACVAPGGLNPASASFQGRKTWAAEGSQAGWAKRHLLEGFSSPEAGRVPVPPGRDPQRACGLGPAPHCPPDPVSAPAWTTTPWPPGLVTGPFCSVSTAHSWSHPSGPGWDTPGCPAPLASPPCPLGGWTPRQGPNTTAALLAACLGTASLPQESRPPGRAWNTVPAGQDDGVHATGLRRPGGGCRGHTFIEQGHRARAGSWPNTGTARLHCSPAPGVGGRPRSFLPACPGQWQGRGGEGELYGQMLQVYVEVPTYSGRVSRTF